MKARVNRAILEQKRFDSGAMGVLESVIHQFAKPGRYLGVVRRNGVTVGSFSFMVSDDATQTQMEIDLATVAGGADHECHCDEAHGTMLAPSGYAVFHASRGSGYAVQVGVAGSKTAEFDSEQLKDGDLFALCLLEPTRYAINDRLGGGKGNITVSFSESDAKRMKSLETMYVDVDAKGFKPASIQAVATQGIVFRVRGRARVVIEKTGSSAPPPTKPKRARARPSRSR